MWRETEIEWETEKGTKAKEEVIHGDNSSSCIALQQSRSGPHPREDELQPAQPAIHGWNRETQELESLSTSRPPGWRCGRSRCRTAGSESRWWPAKGEAAGGGGRFREASRRASMAMKKMNSVHLRWVYVAFQCCVKKKKTKLFNRAESPDFSLNKIIIIIMIIIRVIKYR